MRSSGDRQPVRGEEKISREGTKIRKGKAEGIFEQKHAKIAKKTNQMLRRFNPAEAG
jgi:hypothetical protein